MEYVPPNIDYSTAIKSVLAQAKGHALTNYPTDDYLLNLLDTATDYLFYLEDRSQ
jgi:hypothetical protein